MIIGVMSTYNDNQFIERALSSLSKVTDKIVVVDGRYSEFPCEGDISTDGTLELARKYAEVIISEPCSEPEKRSKYFIGKEGDIYFQLDADEEIELGTKSTIFKKMKNCDIGIVKIYSGKTGVSFRRARLFKHINGMRYAGLHYRLVDGEGKTYAVLDRAGEGYKDCHLDIVIRHNNYFRPSDRKKAKSIYYSYLTSHEEEVKSELKRKGEILAR